MVCGLIEAICRFLEGCKGRMNVLGWGQRETAGVCWNARQLTCSITKKVKLETISKFIFWVWTVHFGPPLKEEEDWICLKLSVGATWLAGMSHLSGAQSALLCVVGGGITGQCFSRLEEWLATPSCASEAIWDCACNFF